MTVMFWFGDLIAETSAAYFAFQTEAKYSCLLSFQLGS